MKKLTKSNFIGVAKIVAEENGIELVKSKIVLLETGDDGVDSMNYIMVEDTRNGKQYQMWKRDEVWTFQEYIQSDDSSVELTELETIVMKAIPQDNFYQDGLDSILWTDCFLEDSLDMDNKEARGILASLIKKGMIVMDIYKEDGKNQSTMALTDEGQDWLLSHGIVDEDGNFKMNTSIIYELNENGNVTEKARYTLDTKQALIAYIMQYKNNNWNTWEYPTELKGIRESKTKQNHYYFDYNDNIVIGSYPNFVEEQEIVEEIQENKEETKKMGETKKMETKKETKKSGTRVILKAFTGMFIGEFEAIKVGKNLEVTTKSGLCIFDAKTLVQKNAKNPRFANKIEIVR